MEEKEQHSSLNRGEDDEPILVLKYVGGRVAWRLFFPYSIAMPIFYMIVFHWAPGKPVSFMTIFSEIVGILFLIIWALLIIDILLTKDFRLYKDRAEKTYRFFEKKQALLKDAVIVLPSMYFRTIYVVPNGSYYERLRKRVSFDCNLGYSKCQEDFTEACKLLGIEFTRKLGGLTGMKSDHNKRG